MDKSREKHYRNFERPPFAPTFEPTEEEFRDPLAYVAKIRPIAEQYGIVKIKPPASFRPPFAINLDTFEFTPRIQKLNELEALSRVKINFLNKIVSFWHLQGTQLKVPLIDNKYLDLYKLHKTVAELGGFDEIVAQKKWQIVAKKMGHKPNQSSSLKQHYNKLLLPYDQSGLANSENASTSSTPTKEPVSMMKGRRRVPETCPPPQKPPIRGARTMAGVALKTLQETRHSPKKQPMNGDPIENVLCHTCGGGDDEERLLLCESCDDSYHIYCLSPPLTAVPKGDWRCPKCVTEAVCKLDEGFGFEQSQRTYTLKSFGVIADKFKEDYFGMPHDKVDADAVETEFWRNVINLENNVTVKYGADLFTDTVGSGFPRMGDKHGDQIEETYAQHAWNLNNLPVLKNSVLSHINVDISGMMVPWVYVGMCFSTFCWHTEDHWTYSINYLHWGEQKIWYGVPADDGDKFETAVKEIAPELFSKQPDLLHHIVTIMNPRLLMEKGINISTVHQNAGEFIITFPRAYHAGFNVGYNFAEAVNFAPSDWMSMGRKCVDYYATMSRFNVFSHDELVCGMAKQAQDLDIGMSIATYNDMLKMVERERDDRKDLRDMGVTESRREVFENVNDDQRQCSVCKTTCYLSALTCPCNADKMVCLRHTKSLCDTCKVSTFILKYRYTLDELPPLMKALMDRTKCFDIWVDKVKQALNTDENGDQKPELDELKQLMENAKTQRFPACEALDILSTAVKHAGRCVEIAEQLIANKIRTRNRQQGLASHSNKLKLSEVEAFIAQLNKLPCKIPQANAIQDFVERVRQFGEDAQKMFQRIETEPPTQVLDDLLELYDQAVAFDLQLNDMQRLKEEAERCKWLIAVDRIIAKMDEAMTIADTVEPQVKKEEEDEADEEEHKKAPVSLERLKSLLTDGVNLSSSGAEIEARIAPRIARLQSLLDDAEQNEQMVHKLTISAEKPTIGAAEKLLAELKPVSLVCARSVHDLRVSLYKAKEWMKKFDKAKRDGGTAALTEQLLTQSRQLPFDLESRLSDLRRDRMRLYDFVAKVEKMFQKPPGYYGTADIISPRRDLTALLEGQRCPLFPRRKRSRVDDWSLVDEHDSTETLNAALNRMAEQESELLERLRTVNEDRPGNSAEICVCRTPCSSSADTEQDLIACRLCRDHFHPTCIRWDPALNELNGIYLCVRCLRGRRPRIEDARAVLNKLEMDGVSIPSLEAVLVRHLLDRTESWNAKTSQLLSTLPRDSNVADLTEEQRSTLNRLIVAGLCLEIATDLSKEMYKWDLLINPPSIRQARLLDDVRRRPLDASSADAPVFAGADKKTSKCKRSHSPSTTGRKKNKRSFHDDEQSCSAPNCLRPYGDKVSWVQCEGGCDQWFHILCVGLTVQSTEQIDSYSCYKCRMGMPGSKLQPIEIC